MKETAKSITERYEARHRRILRRSLVVSVLFHIMILLLFREEVLIPPSPFAAAGPRSGDARAAAGGGTQIIAVNIVPVPPQPVPEVVAPVPVPTPTPEPEVKPVVEEPPKPQVVEAAAAMLAREGTGTTGEGRGDKSGEGMEGGTGRGDGGTAEEGLFRLVPPSPRGLILPPSDRPGKVRGKEIDVWVFVTMKGEVVADSTRIAPPTGDRKFDERLRKQASEWVFEPAKKEGRAISEWFRYTLIL
jgi:outer membrane biosynthesis protein TonB